MNILFIAFEFPPLSRGGVFRSAFFSGALTKFNINPIVITLHPESFEAVYDDYSVDQTIGKNIRETTAIVPLRSASVKDKNKLGKLDRKSVV